MVPVGARRRSCEKIGCPCCSGALGAPMWLKTRDWRSETAATARFFHSFAASPLLARCLPPRYRRIREVLLSGLSLPRHVGLLCPPGASTQNDPCSTGWGELLDTPIMKPYRYKSCVTIRLQTFRQRARHSCASGNPACPDDLDHRLCGDDSGF